jgi:acetoin utilization protein AcuB
MIASELVSQIFAPLRTSDSGEEAMTIMHVYHVKHMPIVNQKQLLGTISEEDILNHDMDEPIGSYGLSLVRAYVNEDAHLFEIMSKMAEYKLTTIPVLGTDDEYIGAITQEKLILFYAETFSFIEPGSIIVLEMQRHDYSMAELSRIIEAEGVLILTSPVGLRIISPDVEDMVLPSIVMLSTVNESILKAPPTVNVDPSHVRFASLVIPVVLDQNATLSNTPVPVTVPLPILSSTYFLVAACKSRLGAAIVKVPECVQFPLMV